MNVTTFQKRLSSTIAAAALVVTGMIFTAQDADAQNPNPVDWTISQTIFGPNGEDLPLRYGQHDFGNTDGFGIYHIQDGHGGFVPSAGEIEIVLNDASQVWSGFQPRKRNTRMYSAGPGSSDDGGGDRASRY